MKFTLSSFTILLLALMQLKAQSGDNKREPSQLLALRKSWEDARLRALQPIDSTYLRELGKLLDTCTKAGKLDDALAVRNEIDRVMGDISPASVKQSKTKDSQRIPDSSAFTNKRWRSPSGTIFIFNSDKTGSQEAAGRKAHISWTQKNNGIVIVEGESNFQKTTLYFNFDHGSQAAFGIDPLEIKTPLILSSEER